MKNILTIFWATIIGFVALSSCTKDGDLVTYNPEAAKPPVSGTTINESYVLTQEGADAVFAEFTFEKADFGVVTPVQYSVVMALATDTEFENAKRVEFSATTTIEIKNSKINALVLDLNGGVEEATSILLKLRAEMMGETVGTGNFVDAPAIATIVTPYIAKIDLSNLSKVWVLGAYNGWSHDDAEFLYNFKADDDTYEGIIDFDIMDGLASHKTDGFKATGAADWENATGNWGVAAEGDPAESPSITLLNGGGNILAYNTYRFYKFEFIKSTLTLSKILGFNQIGIIGNGGKWEATDDIIMDWNPSTQRFYADATLTGDGIKFRTDGAWTNTNWGGTLESIAVGGGNIPVTAGDYRVYLYISNSGKVYAELDASMFGQDEPMGEVAPAPDPDPEPEPQVWSLIGTIGGTEWTDTDMTEVSTGVWKATKVAITATDEFKVRFGHKWDTSFGGPEGNSESGINPENIYPVYKPTLGTAFTATATEAKNIMIGTEGVYNITYDTGKGEILIETYVPTWGVVGSVNGNNWKFDAVMTESEGIWTSGEITIEGEFKLRVDGTWSSGIDRGATNEAEKALTLGTAVAVSQGKSNMSVVGVDPTKKYIVIYNVAAETITVNEAP